jgi:hypothetical protein
MGNYCKKKKEPLEKMQYFSYLNKIKNQYYKSILNNNNNNRIALQKKDFEKIRQIKIVSNENLRIKDVDWFIYISKYFRKKYKEGFLWYKNIIDKISEENFLYEMEYQSYAFYKDFELKFKSKSLKNIDNEKELEKNEDKEEALISSISKNSMIDLSRNSKIELSGITDNYGGSFDDYKDDIDSYEEDLGFRAKKKLKEFIKVLKKHLNMWDHPINIIISIYCKHFALALENQVELFLNMKNNNNDFDKKIKNFSDLIIEDLKRFIIKIQTTTKLFYCKSINLEFFIEEKDELINLVTSIIFLKENIYQNIYSLFEIQFKNEVNDFKYKLYLVKDTKPIDLNIPNKLSLDENTYREILKMKVGSKKDDDKESFKENKNFVPEDGYIKGFHNKNKIEGYNTVVTMIHGLKHAKTPFDKMMIIASMSTEITQCVDTYWNNMDDYLPNYYLSINADEFLSLFILVIIKAQFPELIIHEKIIQFFTTKTTKSSTIGYYNVTLNAAIEYIQNEAIKNLNNNNNDNRLRNSGHLISKYLYQNTFTKDNTDEFILIDNKGKNINSNVNNITKSNSNKNNIINKKKTTISKTKKREKNLLGIENDLDEVNFELSIKKSDD